MRAYKAWFQRDQGNTRKRLCAGAVRVEPDADRRKSMALKALSLMNKVVPALSLRRGRERRGGARHRPGCGLPRPGRPMSADAPNAPVAYTLANTFIRLAATCARSRWR